MNRRGFFGILAGVLILGRTKPPEPRQAGVSKRPHGRKLYAATDWGRSNDIGVTVVWSRDADGTFCIEDEYECTSEQIEDGRCPCRRYFVPTRVHYVDQPGRFLESEASRWQYLVLPRVEA